jgi:serine/threonine protein kinase
VLPSATFATATGGSVRLPASIARLIARVEAERRLGPFVLVEQLGRGGFAPVWMAQEVYGETVLRTAAVKLFALPRAGGAAERERGRIIAEAQALCRVEHTNVVRFYALPLDDGEEVMGLAMEHVAGAALNRRIERGVLDAKATLAVGAAIASALAAVHRAGLIHRDVKPSNIIEAQSGYKLIDFGIAGVDSGDDDLPESNAEAIDRTQRVAMQVGTTGYMDPECVAERIPAEPVSDLYALGATLYECLVGHVPALKKNHLDLTILEGRTPPPKVVDLAPGTPAALAELVDALLSPRRAERPQSAEWVATRLEHIRREIGGTARSLPPERVGPFRGLGRFEDADRDLYFGRSSEVAAALETLRGRGLVALLGPSGSGKSSLARAGVLPAVAEGALGDWPKAWDVVVAVPGRDAKAAVLSALGELVPEHSDMRPQSLVARLAERAHGTGRGTLLFIDQLEEMATLSEAPSAAFLAELLREVGERPLQGVRAVVAARRDLLDPLLAIGDLGKVLLRGSVLVEPFTDSTWADVIERALGAYGYAFEDAALREEVLSQIAKASEAMPLVQFALTALWAERDTKRKRLTRRGLDELGGLAGALERHADASLATIRTGPDVPINAPRALLLALTTARGTRATRSLVELEGLVGPSCGRIVEALESGRLVVRQANAVTLAHDVLISSWGTLAEWLAEERDQRLFAEELERAGKIWASDREQAPLWRRRRLEEADDLFRSHAVVLSEDARAFLVASRRNERRRRLLTLGSVLLLAGLAAGITIAYLSAVRAEQVKTAQALRDEQASRRIAERRTREVQEGQARIDQLLKDLAESPKKEEIRELQTRIRETVPGSARPVERRARPEAVREARPTSEPAALPAAPRPSAPPSSVKVQEEW